MSSPFLVHLRLCAGMCLLLSCAVLVGRHLQAKEEALPAADGAGAGRLLCGELVAAVQADPAAGCVGNEELLLGQQLPEGLEAARVAVLHLRDLLQLPGDLLEALCPGLCRKGGVDPVMLLRLVFAAAASRARVLAATSTG